MDFPSLSDIKLLHWLSSSQLDKIFLVQMLPHYPILFLPDPADRLDLLGLFLPELLALPRDPAGRLDLLGLLLPRDPAGLSGLSPPGLPVPPQDLAGLSGLSPPGLPALPQDLAGLSGLSLPGLPVLPRDPVGLSGLSLLGRPAPLQAPGLPSGPGAP